MFVISFADAGAKPGTMVIHLFDADSTNITMTGSGWSVDIAGETKLDSIDTNGLRNNIAYLNMTLNVLVLGNGQIFFIWFASL